jgi:hypothetical protein
MKPLKVVKVTKTEFVLENGDVFPHMVELDKVPSIEEFQKIYDNVYKQFADFLPEENEGDNDD